MAQHSKKNTNLGNEQLVLHWREHPVQAAKDILGVKLDVPQQLQLNAWWTHDTSTSIFTRGGGKTFCGAVWCSLQGLLYAGQRVGIVTPSFRQSQFVFIEIEKLYAKSAMYQEASERPPIKAPEACRLKLRAAPGKVGSVIEGLPMGNDGGKIRGARYYRVFADELAQIDADTLDTVVNGFMATLSDPMERVELFEQELARLIADGTVAADQVEDIRNRVRRGESLPGKLTAGESNKLVQASTAYFQYNHLWHQRVAPTIKMISQEYHDAQRRGEDTSRFKLQGGSLNNQIPHRFMSNGTECLVAFECDDMHPFFMDFKRIATTMSKMSDYKARMEYRCFFPPDSEGFYRRSLLDAARTHKQFTCQEDPRKGMIYVIGIDPARSGDNFTIAIFEIDVHNGCVNLIRIMAWNKKNFPHMHQEVRQVIKHYGVTHIGMDAGGGGTTVRDLLASKENCPTGQRLILERDFDEHRSLVGDRILWPLIQFSSADWCHDSNFGLLSDLQHSRLKIAAKSDNHHLIWTPKVEEMELELEEALTEWSSIIPSQSGTRTKWDTPADGMRKDRYSAILIGNWIAQQVLARQHKPESLPMGGWAGQR